MAIKVTIGESKTQDEKPFPKLMQGISGTIVLFQQTKKGFVVNAVEGVCFIIGEYSDDWAMHKFTDYNEPITLQNQ
jgi:hypothetical protein